MWINVNDRNWVTRSPQTHDFCLNCVFCATLRKISIWAGKLNDALSKKLITEELINTPGCIRKYIRACAMFLFELVMRDSVSKLEWVMWCEYFHTPKWPDYTQSQYKDTNSCRWIVENCNFRVEICMTHCRTSQSAQSLLTCDCIRKWRSVHTMFYAYTIRFNSYMFICVSRWFNVWWMSWKDVRFSKWWQNCHFFGELFL